MNWLGRWRAFDSELSFDSCTLVGSASSELKLFWVCISEEDEWLIRGDSAKSSHLTRRQNGKSNRRKTSPYSPTQSSQVPHYCGSPTVRALCRSPALGAPPWEHFYGSTTVGTSLWEHFCRSITVGATAAGIPLLEPCCEIPATGAVTWEHHHGIPIAGAEVWELNSQNLHLLPHLHWRLGSSCALPVFSPQH